VYFGAKGEKSIHDWELLSLIVGLPCMHWLWLKLPVDGWFVVAKNAPL
jgi:hypothetical protein